MNAFFKCSDIFGRSTKMFGRLRKCSLFRRFPWFDWGCSGGCTRNVPGVFRGIFSPGFTDTPPKLAHAIIETKSKTKPIQGILRYAIFCFHENWRLTFLGVLKLISRTINKISRVAQSNAGLFRKKRGLMSKEITVLLPWESETRKSGFINWVVKVNWPPYRN